MNVVVCSLGLAFTAGVVVVWRLVKRRAKLKKVLEKRRIFRTWDMQKHSKSNKVTLTLKRYMRDSTNVGTVVLDSVVMYGKVSQQDGLTSFTPLDAIVNEWYSGEAFEGVKMSGFCFKREGYLVYIENYEYVALSPKTMEEIENEK